LSQLGIGYNTLDYTGVLIAVWVAGCDGALLVTVGYILVVYVCVAVGNVYTGVIVVVYNCVVSVIGTGSGTIGLYIGAVSFIGSTGSGLYISVVSV
jgi:hypothetical protein